MSNEITALLFYQVAAFGLSLLLGRKSQVNAWAEENHVAAALLKFFRATSIDPWMLVQSLSLAVKERLPKSVETPTSIAGRREVEPYNNEPEAVIPPPPRMPSTHDDDTPPPPQAG